jgi:hypothetical protein
MASSGAKQVSWKRVGLCLAIIFAAGWLALLLTLHIGVWYIARKTARDPMASITPQRLSNTGVADLKDGEEVSAFGYVFDLPWKVLKRSDARTGTLSMLTLRNGTQITISLVQNAGMGPDLIANSTPGQAAAFRSMYRPTALASRYGWLEAELGSTPADISFWRSRRRTAGALTFMMLKESVIGKAKVVYTIAGGGMRGFQIGDPLQPTPAVWLRLFDEKDQPFWILLRRAQNGVGFTQEQINAIVASIRPAMQ